MKRLLTVLLLAISLDCTAATTKSPTTTESSTSKSQIIKPVIEDIFKLSKIPLYGDCISDKCKSTYPTVQATLAATLYRLKASIGPACIKIEASTIPTTDTRYVQVQKVLTEDCSLKEYLDPYIQTSVDAFSIRLQHILNALELIVSFDTELGPASKSSESGLSAVDQQKYMKTLRDRYDDDLDNYIKDGYFK